MLSTLVLMFLVRSATASADDETVIIPRCSNSPETRMSFTAVEGFVGRYTAELCTERNYTSKEWELKLSFYGTRHYCNSSFPSDRKLRPGKLHSSNFEWISSEHKCTDNQTVCMSAQFDLIFSACYSVMSSFKDKSAPPNYFYFNVTNPYTAEYFHKNVPKVDVAYHPNDMSVTWHTGVPPSVYKVDLCNETDIDSCVRVPGCVTTDKTTIKCTLSPEYGCYIIYLKHSAPWILGIFYSQESVSYPFCRSDTSSDVKVSGSVWHHWVWVAVGTCAALSLAMVCAWLACRSIAATKKQKEVLRWWLEHRNEEAPVEASETAARTHVLLLYAREGAAAARAVAALKAALQHVVDGQVYDIFSAEVTALSARAPGEWVRTLLQRADVRVVLLQSPALHCLYTTLVVDSDAGLKLAAPLLGRRVAPRVPQFGDALLQFALRVIAESVHSRDNYNKYYIATISELPTELVPCTVPYRRYALPAAAALLLRDVSAPRTCPAPVALLDRFTVQLNEFVDYARDHPDYLMDEMMLIDG